MRMTNHEPDYQPLVISANEPTWRAIYDKLAAYEDTGLTPETCKDIKSLCDDYVDAGLDASFILTCIAAARAGISSKRMTEISKAETDNRLIILPCKVGDMVYYKRRGWVCGDTVKIILFDAFGYHVRLDYEHKEFDFEDFGKTVFASREEAEAALKGGTGDV